MFRRFDFKVPFLSASFIFQEQCPIKIEHVLFPSVFFFKVTDLCVGKHRGGYHEYITACSVHLRDTMTHGGGGTS